MSRRHPHSRLTTLTTALVASLGVAACGEVLQLAEIEGSGFSDGTASGYGSVYVNGTRFSTTSARIRIDGVDATEDDLRVGMQLQIDGDVLAARADVIEHDRDLRGPVDAIDRDNAALPDATLQVLGQRVQVNSLTRYLGVTLDTLDTDDLIDVSGLRVADDTVLATLVTLRDGFYTPASATVDVEGTVSALRGTIATVGQAQVELSGTALSGVVAVGDRIEAAGVQATRGGLITADSARLRVPRTDTGPRAQLEGVIRTVNGSDIRIGETTIDLTSASRGDAVGGPLLAGQRVIVDGTTATGAQDIVATSVTVIPDAPLLLTGQITANALSTSTFTLLDQQIRLLPHTQWLDASDAQVRRFRNDRLNVGDTVRVVAYLDANGGVVASRVTRLNPLATATLRGTAGNINAASRQLSILGVRVTTDANTVYIAPSGAQESAVSFFSAIDETSTVMATGPLTGTATLDADRLTR